jgi:hypothetical protein
MKNFYPTNLLLSIPLGNAKAQGRNDLGFCTDGKRVTFAATKESL